MTPESWARLARASEFYESRGFKYKDVPWYVSEEISSITKPDWCVDFHIGDACLVGSAEQSFLSIYEELDGANYYAITPCFRDEDEITEFTKIGFMKLELFSKNNFQLQYFLKCARTFFLEEAPFYSNIECITLGVDDYDLNYKGIELGSYNVKRHGNMTWACGTGLAEPRFTAALKRGTK